MIFFIDLENFIIPDSLNFLIMGLALFKNFIPSFNTSLIHDINQSLIGGIIGYFSIWLIIFLYKTLKKIDGMGLGDAKLMAGIGLLFGWQSIPLVLFLSSILGLFFVAPSLLKKQKTNEVIIDGILKEKLCKRGYNYIASRKRKGEKHNPFLTARAVKVCKGQMSGSDGKQKKDFRPRKGKKRSAQGAEPDIVKEIGVKLSNYSGQVLPGDVVRAPKGFPLGGKKLEKGLQLKVIKNSREGVNRYKLSLEDPKTGKKYSVRNFQMDGEYKGEKFPKWSMVRRSKQNIKEDKYLLEARYKKFLNEAWEDAKASVVNEFVNYCMEYLSVDRPKLKLINSKDYAYENRSLGGYSPSEKKIMVVVHNRNMADILRTIAHEMVHHMQNLDKRLTPTSGEDGSPDENEANSLAGVIMRKFGRDNPQIYE